MDMRQGPQADLGPPGAAAPWTVAAAPEPPRQLGPLHELAMPASLTVQAQEQSAAAAENAGQREEAGPVSLPPSEAGAGPASAATGPLSELEMLPAYAGSPSVTAEGIASGGQGSGWEGVDERDGGSGGREAQPAAAASSGKLVVRSREQFMRVWKRFMLSRSLDATPPLFHRATMDLFKLFRAVYKLGGHDEVVRQKGWARIGRMFNPPSSMTDLSFQTKRIYATKLLEFEKAYQAGQIAAEIQLEGPVASPEAGAKPAAAMKPRPGPRPQLKPSRPTPPASTASLAGAASESRHTRGQQRLQEEAETEAAEAAAALAAAAVAAVTASEHPQQAGQEPMQLLLPASMHMEQQQLKQEPELGLPGLAGEAALPVTSPRQLPRPPSRARSRSRASSGARASRPAGSARAATSLKAAQGAAAAPQPGAPPGGAAAMEVEQTPPVLPAFLPSLSLPSAAVPEGSQQTVAAGAGEPAVAGPFPRLSSSQRPQRASRAARMRTAQPEGAASAEAMVGRRIGIWWDDDTVFYYGAVTAFDPLTQMHTLLYDDGPEEELALAFEHWVFADGRQQGRPAPQPLALLGSWDLGPAEEGQQAQQGQPAKRARTEELLGSAGGGAAAAPPPGLFGQGPGAAASQLMLADLAQPVAGMPGGLLPGAVPPTSRDATPQLPGAPARCPLAEAAPSPSPQTPPKLVASGRNYRVFTSGSLPAGFELFMLLPGMSIDEVSVRCWSSGLVLVKAEPWLRRQPSAAAELAADVAAPGELGGGGTGAEAPPTPRPVGLAAVEAAPAAAGPSPESVQIQLPSRVDTRSATAQFTAVGQLYVRINIQE